MAKSLLIHICLPLLFISVLFAQKEANIWYFGNHAGIDFNPAIPVALTNSALNTNEGCASIADASTGQLLFYTDGITVFNRTHSLLFNGNGLLGDNSSTQSAIIIPRPGSSRYFYIFAVDDVAGFNGCTYSEVDMNLAGGLGGITSNKNQLLFTPGTEKLASACHGNGTDYWMISHSFGNNNFYAYQITAAGLNLTPVISSVGAIHGGPNTHALGELEVSPDASRIALCTWLGTLLQVFDFDNNTGIVSNPITLPSTGEEYGCAFSPDGSKVYYASCCISPNDIVQFDLNAGSPAAIAASRVVVWNGSPSTGKGTMQNGPDGRIYVAPLYQPSLDVILNPNAPGLTCGYSAMGFPLGGRTSLLGLPNMVSCLVTTILDAEFKAFYAEVTEMDRVQLHWSAMESTPKGTYVVERSADGAYFYEIGDVAFQGNRPELAQLSFLDRNPLPDFNLYRIKVTDPNGEVSVSEVVEVALGSALDSSLGISPNPAQNMAQLSFFVQAGHTAPWQMRVFSLAGKLLLEKNLGVLPPGHFVQDINLSRLAAGMYTFQLQCGSRKQVTQLLMME